VTKMMNIVLMKVISRFTDRDLCASSETGSGGRGLIGCVVVVVTVAGVTDVAVVVVVVVSVAIVSVVVEAHIAVCVSDWVLQTGYFLLCDFADVVPRCTAVSG